MKPARTVLDPESPLSRGHDPLGVHPISADILFDPDLPRETVWLVTVDCSGDIEVIRRRCVTKGARVRGAIEVCRLVQPIGVVNISGLIGQAVGPGTLVSQIQICAGLIVRGTVGSREIGCRWQVDAPGFVHAPPSDRRRSGDVSAVVHAPDPLSTQKCGDGTGDDEGNSAVGHSKYGGFHGISGVNESVTGVTFGGAGSAQVTSALRCRTVTFGNGDRAHRAHLRATVRSCRARGSRPTPYHRRQRKTTRSRW